MENKFLKKVTFLFNEESNTYLPVVDKMAYFKKLSNSLSAKKFKNFRRKKIEQLQTLTNIEKVSKKTPPIPGGVGYGVYYKQEFQWAFTNFSCLDFCILSPDTIGGNSNSFLYLTATNGTAKGVEALISYDGQDKPFFKVFDWALPDKDKWTISLECINIPENFSIININGLNHNFCRVINKTEMVAPNIWENKVYLLNFQGNNWDNVYSHQYISTLKEQKSVDFGSWGPIVETFQPMFTDLNPLGFSNAFLYNDSVSSLLNTTNSFIRNDNDGIDIVFIEPNHSFYVK